MSSERSQFVSLHEDGLRLLDVHEKTSVKLGLPFQLPDQTEPVCVLHCNGMLCLTLKDNNSLAVLNPVTTQFKIIPVVKPGQKSNLLGFGYDRFVDDYKVVTIIDRRTYVFEFKANCWKESKPVPSRDFFFKNRAGTVVGHHMYWIAYRSDNRNSILCFDFSKEEYQELTFPMYSETEFDSWLGVLRGELCVIDHYRELSDDICVWAPERRGTKIVKWNSFDWAEMQEETLSSGEQPMEIAVACVTRDDKLMITLTGYGCGDKMLIYETKGKKFRRIRFCEGTSSLRGFRCMSDYVKSSGFVSVDKP